MRKPMTAKEKVLDILWGIAGLAVLAFLFVALPLYYMGKIYIVDGSSLTAEEHNAICREYGLDSEMAVIDRIYSRLQSYGIRIVVDENDLADLNVLFSEKILADEDSNYYLCSDNTCLYELVSETKNRFLFPAEQINAVYAGGGVIYRKDGVYYLELKRSMSDNIEIYCKNIK